jgi:lysophospholipid acyltransferase (LPLAT)-like uncharacterized protein
MEETVGVQNLIEGLRAILKKYGNIPVVTGLSDNSGIRVISAINAALSDGEYVAVLVDRSPKGSLANKAEIQ